jgi:intein-encoded DNA endonuclease-like protein
MLIAKKERNKMLYIPFAPRFDVDVCYILGVLKGDGYVKMHKRNPTQYHKHQTKAYYIGLKAKDEDFVKAFANTLERIFKRKCKIYSNSKNGKTYYYTSLSSHSFYDWYTNLTIKEIKDALTRLDESEICAFLRGFYDSEGGCVTGSQNKKVVFCCNTNKDLIDLINCLLQKIGVSKTRIIEQKGAFSDKIVYRLDLWRKDDIDIFRNKVSFSIERKNAKLHKTYEYKKHEWEDNELEAIVKLTKEGKSDIEISRIIPHTEHSIKVMRQKLGIKYMIRRTYTEDVKQKIITMRESGLSFSKISKILNLPKTSIRLICSRYKEYFHCPKCEEERKEKWT